MTFLLGFSPDEETLLYCKSFANTYSLIYAKRGQEDILLTPPTDQQHTVSDAVFVSDSLVYLLTDYNSDFSYLALFNLETNQFIKVKEIENESLSGMSYSKEQQILYIRSRKGCRRLFI